MEWKNSIRAGDFVLGGRSTQFDQIDLLEDRHEIRGGAYSGSTLEIEFYDPYQITFLRFSVNLRIIVSLY